MALGVIFIVFFNNQKARNIKGNNLCNCSKIFKILSK